jgi:hypothetical protein
MMEIHSDYSEVEREISRLEKMPDPRMVALLNTVLEFGFSETTSAVHIDTGSLKESGKSEHEKRNDEWEGSFTFGGPSTGPNNPVDYAIYELARGDEHFFLSPAMTLGPLWETAIRTGLGK